MLTTVGKPATAGTLATACTPQKKGFNRIGMATKAKARISGTSTACSKNNMSSRIDTNKREHWNFRDRRHQHDPKSVGKT